MVNENSKRISNEEPGDTPRVQESASVGDAEWQRNHAADDTPETRNPDDDNESLPPETPVNYRQRP